MWWMCAALMVALCGVAQAAEADPVARTKALVEAFKAVKSAPEGKPLSAADKKHNEKAFAALDGFFDQAHLKATPIAPHADKLDDAQKKKFGELFWQVMRLVAYPDSGDFLREAKYTLAKDGKTNVRMEARLEKEDLDVDALFYWKAGKDGTLRIIDVAFDNAPLMKDYQNQFGRILAKNGAQGLLDMLEKKLAEEKKKRGM
jgi:ABC-type transporter MlaC component